MIMEDIETIPDGARLRTTVQLPNGLHARPAAKLSRAAQRYRSQIRLVTDDGGEADAKSILDVLSLARSHGSPCPGVATGADAREAVGSVAVHLESEQA